MTKHTHQQTIRQAMAATRVDKSNMARAACALDGCPVGGWGETAQAMRQIAEYLPSRSERTYSVAEFVAAAYYVDHADRYRSR
jgi:hypothetical protein